MAEYISRDDAEKALLERCKETGYGGLTPDDIRLVMRTPWRIPPADVRPVVRGKWQKEDDGTLFYRCSACGKALYGCFAEIYMGEVHYCPNCGADMREAEEGE